MKNLLYVKGELNQETARDLANTCNAIDAKLAAKAFTPSEQAHYSDYRKKLVKARIAALNLTLIRGGKDE
jgi:hypothetical protein